jgi:hypothetical protein
VILLVAKSSIKNCAVLVSIKLDIPNILRRLAYLQVGAINNQMPIALVYISDQLEPVSKNLEFYNNLLKLEHSLSPINIPLILLIGDYQTRLDGFKYHINPKIIDYGDTDVSIIKELELHPHSWPATVIKVKDLKAILFGERHSC